MKAGASSRVMEFPEGFFPVEGFSVQLDDLHARVLGSGLAHLLSAAFHARPCAQDR